MKREIISFLIILYSSVSYSQINSEVLFSNIYISDNSGKFIKRFPVNEFNRLERGTNQSLVKLDSIDLFFNQCINEFRKDYGLDELKYDHNLSEIAYCQGLYILRTGNVGHYNDRYGDTPMDRTKFFGFTDFQWIGEVCLRDVSNMQEYPNKESVNLEYTRTILDLYWTSPHHREILQSTKYKRFGYFNSYDLETHALCNVIVLTD